MKGKAPEGLTESAGRIISRSRTCQYFDVPARRSVRENSDGSIVAQNTECVGVLILHKITFNYFSKLTVDKFLSLFSGLLLLPSKIIG